MSRSCLSLHRQGRPITMKGSARGENLHALGSHGFVHGEILGKYCCKDNVALTSASCALAISSTRLPGQRKGQHQLQDKTGTPTPIGNRFLVFRT